MKATPGRHIYVIKSGTVEVVANRPDGSTEVIDRLGPGDHFGDVALLRRNLPYRSTVRTVTAAHIFRISPGVSSALRQLAGVAGVSEAKRRTASAPASGA